jgi:dephospho-CoA kinase
MKQNLLNVPLSLNKPLKIGITGGIGSGKSIVCKIFETLSYPVYNADDRAKWLVSNDTDLKSEIIELLGEEAFLNNKYNKVYVANKVFNNQDLLNKLNSLIHPKVGIDFEKWVIENKNHSIVLKEAALMFESDSYKALDQIITVVAPLQFRIKNILNRDINRSEEEIKNIISKQLSDEEKIKKSDFVIKNDDILPILPQVIKILNTLEVKY